MAIKLKPRGLISVFDHIPKTAGNSMQALLEEIHGPEKVKRLPTGFNGDTLSGIDPVVSCFTGHFWFPPGAPLKADLWYFTFLRAPIERAISVYYHARNLVESGPLAELARAVPISEFIYREEPYVLEAVSNLYVRHFAEPMEGPGSEYEKARTRLELYDFVGFVESLEPSFDLLCAERGWRFPHDYPKLNVSRDRSTNCELDKNGRKHLARLNEQDLALFEEARSLFERRRRQFFRKHLFIPRHEPSPVSTPANTGYGLKVLSSEESPAKISSVRAVPALGRQSIGTGTEFHVDVFFRTREHIDNLKIGIGVRGDKELELFGTNSALLSHKPIRLTGGRDYLARFTLRARLAPGEYALVAALHDDDETRATCYDWVFPATKLIVSALGPAFVGLVDLEPRFCIKEGADAIDSSESVTHSPEPENDVVGKHRTRAHEKHTAHLSDADFVTACFAGFLRRLPRQAEVVDYCALLQAGTLARRDVPERLLFSEEFESMIVPVASVYYSLQQRPSPAALDNWRSRLQAGGTLSDVALHLMASEAFIAKFGALSDEKFLTAIYLTVLRRPPDPTGRNHWLRSLQNGSESRTTLIVAFSQAPETKARYAERIRVELLQLWRITRKRRLG